jgi:hypothetical protein
MLYAQCTIYDTIIIKLSNKFVLEMPSPPNQLQNIDTAYQHGDTLFISFKYEKTEPETLRGGVGFAWTVRFFTISKKRLKKTKYVLSIPCCFLNYNKLILSCDNENKLFVKGNKKKSIFKYNTSLPTLNLSKTSPLLR